MRSADILLLIGFAACYIWRIFIIKKWIFHDLDMAVDMVMNLAMGMAPDSNL